MEISPPTARERLATIETEIKALTKRVDGIYKILAWIATTIGGSVLVAIGNFIVNGGFGK